MPHNNSKQLHIDRRRAAVSKMRLRGFTQREIEAGLGEMGILNPNTEKPYDLATVNRDIKFLQKQWKDSAETDFALLKATHLAELKEVQRAGWQRWSEEKKGLFYVLEAAKQIANVCKFDADDKTRDAARALEQIVGDWEEGMKAEDAQEVKAGE